MKNKRHFTAKLYPKKAIKRIDSKINLLGSNLKYDSVIFLNFRTITSILLFIIIFFLFKNSYLYAPLFTILYFYFLEHITLDSLIKKRTKKLEDEAIFFFEVLELTLESGRNLKSSLNIACRNVDSELSSEFKNALSEIKLGKSFTESMNSLKERIPSEAINNVILNLTESNVYGSSILECLNTQLDYLREKKIFSIKAEISKLPTKISIISVIFFVPLMILIILAPVLIDFLNR
jgi:tight adherence protein C